jgi:hypothetical protein
MKINLQDMLDNFRDEEIQLSSYTAASPDRVSELTKRKIEEDNMNMKHKKIISIPLVAAIVAVIVSATAFASYHLLSPKEIASRFDEKKLSEVFSDGDTRFNFEPQTSGDYTFHLFGIASGKGLSCYTENADEDKSYVVGAVSRADGKPLSEYPGVMITPLVSGYKPWEVNAFTIGGGRSEFIDDDEYTDYFIFECSNLEIFADHTVYMAMYEMGEGLPMAPGTENFIINDDGSISFNPSYTAAHAMFVLPLDASKADPAAVQKLLEEKDEDEDDIVNVASEEEGETEARSFIISQDEAGEFVVEEEK